MTRQEIYKAFDTERDYQDQKWGGESHDKNHNLGNWILYLERHLNKAKEAEYEGYLLETTDELRKIGALVVAACEKYGVELRK